MNALSDAMVRGFSDRLLGTVQSISSVFWYEPDGMTQVAGGIPTVDANGNMTWTTGAPPAGTAYTIEGIKFLEVYVYMGLPLMRNIGANGLPLKLLARRYDLFGR